MSQEVKTSSIKGGEFLIRSTDPQEIFIPEQFDEEQKMIFGLIKKLKIK